MFVWREKKKGKKSSEEKSGRNFLPFGSQEKIEKKNRGCECFPPGPTQNFLSKLERK
jgi:hypothetical protein